ILSRLPGETLPVLIRRDQAVIKRDLPLGAFENLTGATLIEEPVLRRAMSLRRARLGIKFPQPDTIGSGIDPDAWIAAAFERGPIAHTQPIDKATDLGILFAGKGKIVYSGFPDYPRRGASWSSQGIAEQAILDTKRAELNTKITDGFLRRSQLVLQINTAQARAKDGPDPDAYQPEIHRLKKQQAMVESEIMRFTNQLDTLTDQDPKDD
ncbi:MAG: hypothetical protein JKY96_06710, partial [Phycisphaerales bacterium]|nr:hypothetical protein [Phycisphaerales bacterium]